MSSQNLKLQNLKAFLQKIPLFIDQMINNNYFEGNTTLLDNLDKLKKNINTFIDENFTD
jgi:hypothetical protein